jgi:hypothetical protein
MSHTLFSELPTVLYEGSDGEVCTSSNARPNDFSPVWIQALVSDLVRR